MKKKLLLFTALFAISVSLPAQARQTSGFTLRKDIMYFSQGGAELYLDLYVPTGQQGPFPVIIWLPLAGTPKFPTPISSFSGNGYAVVSVSNSDINVPGVISRITGFLKSNAQKYNLDPKNTGVIQQVEKGYLAVTWKDAMKKLELLSDAEVRISIGAASDKDFLKLQAPANSKILLGFFDRHLREGAHIDSDPLTLLSPPDSWADPVMFPVPGTTYTLFPTPSRGKNTKGSFLVLLPQNYASSTDRLPVIYWLHGENTGSRDGAWMADKMKQAMTGGEMPPAIVVFVQPLPTGWYVNSADSTMPVEDVIIKDLIPFVDANYRTIKSPGGRAIEGFSMGGYGALHLGLKYPGLFGAISAIDPIFPGENSANESVVITFGADTALMNSYSPLRLTSLNCTSLRENTTVRIISRDSITTSGNIRDLGKLLDGCGIKNSIILTKSDGRNYKDLIGSQQGNALVFWKERFSVIK
ncbi:MAG: alpha/beta hydrolase-fold protein [Bacteroidales bacterium]